MAALASAASAVFPSRHPWAWQCMVITTRAQSAGMQEPNKQNRQTVEGICCALDMIWMQDVFSISHSSDSWDFFSGWKGESRLHSRSVCACVYVTLQVYLCSCGNCVNTVGVCVHLCTYIFCKVLTQQAIQTDTAANSYVLSSSRVMEGRWLASSTWSVGIWFIMAVCFTLAVV